MTKSGWANAAVFVVLVLAGCGTDSDSTTNRDTASSSASPSMSPQELAFVEEALPFASAIEPREDVSREERLLAVGKDWCRWRQSPEYGSVTVEQFFGELLIEAADGQGIREAAELHLCPV